MIRLAETRDIDRIAEIYEAIHTEEEAGNTTIGWIRGVYPTKATAEASVKAKDMYVMTVPAGKVCTLFNVCEDQDEIIVAAARINREQVDVYVNADWTFDAPDDEVMVLHTLVVDPKVKGNGYGSDFVAYYEDFALKSGCKYLRMDTNARNTAARALYAKLGYKEVGIVDSIFNGIPDVKLVCLEKTL